MSSDIKLTISTAKPIDINNTNSTNGTNTGFNIPKSNNISIQSRISACEGRSALGVVIELQSKGLPDANIISPASSR